MKVRYIHLRKNKNNNPACTPKYVASEDWQSRAQKELGNFKITRSHWNYEKVARSFNEKKGLRKDANIRELDIDDCPTLVFPRMVCNED